MIIMALKMKINLTPTASDLDKILYKLVGGE